VTTVDEEWPLVDVLLATCEVDSKLTETITSVINGRYKNLRLQVILDFDSIGSSKNSILPKRLNIIYHENTKNRGLTAVLIEQVANSDAPLIARIDRGDVWLEQKLEVQVAFLKSNPCVSLVGSQVEYFDESRNALGISKFPTSHAELTANARSGFGVFEHSSILFKNEINYRDFFRYSQDLDLYVRIAQRGRLGNINEVLVRCLTGNFGITLRNKPLQRRYIQVARKGLTDSQLFSFGKIQRVSALEWKAWDFSSFWFRKYLITARSNKYKSKLYLLCAAIIYPPLFVDYILKIYLVSIRKFK